MDTSTVAWLSGVVVIVVSALIEHFSKTFKPWSIIARTIGKAINAENLEKLTSIEKRITKLEENDDMQKETRMQDKAEDARRRIISFADEIRRGVQHSNENFNNVLDDITFYTHYCEDHPKFKNEKAVRSIGIIDETYDKCHSENSFL